MTRAQRAGDGAPLQIDDLVARIDRAVWNLVPGYNDATLSHGEYVRYLTGNIERLLDAVTKRRSFTRDDMTSAHELGERRADQGMPFESMVRSYHLSERIMLDTLLAAHGGLGADQLRPSVSLLHENNGALAEASYLAFLGTLMTITASHDVLTRLRGSLVAALIERDAQAVRRVATVLGVSEQLGSASRAMVLRPPDGIDAGQVRRRVVASLQRQHAVVADGPWNRALVVIAEEPDGGAADLAGALDGLTAIAGWRVAIGSRARDAAGVSDSIEDAITALRFVRREGERPGQPVVVLFDDVQAETLLTGDARRAAALITHHLGPILDDQDLMETLAAFVDVGGSIKRTAERLFLHPNSVTYRLNKISVRLGRDPRDFADLVDLALAVRTHTALRLAGNDVVGS